MQKLPVSRTAVRLVTVTFLVAFVTVGLLTGRALPISFVLYMVGVVLWIEVAVTVANAGPERWELQWLVSAGTMAALCGMVWFLFDYARYGPVILGLYVLVAATRLGLAGGLFISGIGSAFLAWVAWARPDLADWYDWSYLTVSLAATAWLVQQYRDHSLAGMVDPLTQLHNRRGLDLYVRAHLRHYKQAAVVLCDLDDLKQINDSQGHEAGDLVLVRTAAAFRRHTGPRDFVCRLGGDEFLLVLAEVNLVRALQILEELRLDIGANAGVTASFGLAMYPRDGHSLREVMAAADAAMYRAKETRNSVARATAE